MQSKLVRGGQFPKKKKKTDPQPIGDVASLIEEYDLCPDVKKCNVDPSNPENRSLDPITCERLKTLHIFVSNSDGTRICYNISSLKEVAVRFHQWRQPPDFRRPMNFTTKVLLENLMGETYLDLGTLTEPVEPEHTAVHQPALWNSLAVRYCSNVKQTALYVCPYCYERACEEEKKFNEDPLVLLYTIGLEKSVTFLFTTVREWKAHLVKSHLIDRKNEIMLDADDWVLKQLIYTWLEHEKNGKSKRYFSSSTSRKVWSTRDKKMVRTVCQDPQLFINWYWHDEFFLNRFAYNSLCDLVTVSKAEALPGTFDESPYDGPLTRKEEAREDIQDFIANDDSVSESASSEVESTGRLRRLVSKKDAERAKDSAKKARQADEKKQRRQRKRELQLKFERECLQDEAKHMGVDREVRARRDQKRKREKLLHEIAKRRKPNDEDDSLTISEDSDDNPPSTRDDNDIEGFIVDDDDAEDGGSEVVVNVVRAVESDFDSATEEEEGEGGGGDEDNDDDVTIFGKEEEEEDSSGGVEEKGTTHDSSGSDSAATDTEFEAKVEGRVTRSSPTADVSPLAYIYSSRLQAFDDFLIMHSNT